VLRVQILLVSFFNSSSMKNLYNKGTFRSYEWGKIPPYLKKYGNKKWRRTEKSAVEDQLSEEVKFRAKRRQKQKLIWVKITKEINGRKYSDYRKYATEKSFKNAIKSAHVITYFKFK
jgi:hypothetical protein